MTVPKFKRRESELEYVKNAYEINVEVMNLVSKLSARWSRIYAEPINKLANMQADLVNMASSIKITTIDDYITRRWFLKLSNACLQALEKRIMEMVRILYNNPSKCFNRKNGKNYSFNEATIMLDKKLENLGVKYGKQYNLIKGVISSDKKKYENMGKLDITDKEIFTILVSKTMNLMFS